MTRRQDYIPVPASSNCRVVLRRLRPPMQVCASCHTTIQIPGATISPSQDKGRTMDTTESQSVIEQFVAAAKAAVATAEVVDRTPQQVCDSILRAAGDADCILFAPPQDLPSELFAEFARDPRVKA